VLLLREQVLSQMADVNEVVTTLDQIAASITRRAIDLENAVSARKVEIRKEIADAGDAAIAKHIAGLNERLSAFTAGEHIMPKPTHEKIAADFAKAIKGKKTIKSVRDARDAELARAKIAASELADLLEKNLKALHENKEHRALFADWRTLIFNDAETCALHVRTRIADHLAEVSGGAWRGAAPARRSRGGAAPRRLRRRTGARSGSRSARRPRRGRQCAALRWRPGCAGGCAHDRHRASCARS
jgi:hypothetical protein